VIGFLERRAGESRTISHGHPGEVKEILKQFGDDALEFGEFNSERPTSKADNALARMFLIVR